jgi:hypothetical protein
MPAPTRFVDAAGAKQAADNVGAQSDLCVTNDRFHFGGRRIAGAHLWGRAPCLL